MRAIIINDNDARALLEQLELLKLRESTMTSNAQMAEIYGTRKETVISIRDELHRSFHYIVTRWLQEQGASIIR